MLLDFDQRKSLLAILGTLYTNRDDFSTFLRDELGKNLDEISTAGNLVDDRSRVVDNAERLEWTLDLIKALYDLNVPGVSAQLALIGTVETIKEARFYDECYIDRYPMVDRKLLRQKLRSVATEKGKRILLVQGNRYAGNSHALRHIRHVALRLAIPFAEFPLARYATGEDLQPYDFGADIAQALDRELPSRLDPKASRWSLNFVNWLGTQVKPTDRLWIAFDDFEKEKLRFALPDSVYEFIHLLCDSVANRLLGVRLFLINYDRALPNEIAFQVDRETVPSIREEDIADFFLDFYRDHVVNADPKVAALEAAKRARAVAGMLATENTARLHRMREALREHCEELKG